MPTNKQEKEGRSEEKMELLEYEEEEEQKSRDKWTGRKLDSVVLEVKLVRSLRKHIWGKGIEVS